MVRNLYDNSFVINYTDGDQSLERNVFPPTNRINDKSHPVIEGDTLNTLAHFYYGDGRKWWKIAERNQLDNNFILEVGSELIIPELESNV